MRDRGGTRTRPPKRQTKGAANLGALAGSVGASQPKRPPPTKHEVDRTMVRATQTGRALTPAESRRAASRFGAFAASVIDVGLRKVAHERGYDSPQAERLRRQQQAALTSPASIDRLMRRTPSFSSAVDSLGENTIGLGMVRPSRAPGNLLHNLGLGAHGLPSDERPGGIKFKRALTTDEFHRFQRTGVPPADAIEADITGGVIPFIPGSVIRRLGGLRGAAPAEAILSRKAARAELENHPFRQAFHANIDRTVADKQLATKMKHTFDRQTLAGAKKAGMRPGRFLEHLRGSEPTPVEHARQRLTQVEKTIEDALQGIEKDMKARMGGKFDPAETIRRNRAKAQAQGKIGGKRAQARGKLEEQRSQKQELRDDAWAALLKYSERDDNVGRTVKGWLDEHDRLRAVVDQHDEQHLFQDPVAAPAETAAVPTAQPEAAQKLIAGLSAGGAKTLRHEQELGYGVERGRRAAAFDEALRANPTLAGHAEASGLLRGALPKVEFNGIRGLTSEEVDSLVAHVANHPGLRPFERKRVIDSMQAAWIEGKVPTRKEYRLLHEAFGTSFATKAFAPSVLNKYRHAAYELINIPRSLMASFDVSAPFRQGLVAFGRHPLMTAKNLRPMFRYLTSEHGYQQYMEDLRSSADFEQMQADGLAITDVEHALTRREEAFQSNYAEAITGFGKKNEHGQYHLSPVRASGRAYTGFLVKTRVDMYRYLNDLAEKQGRPLDEEGRSQLASYINAATGRGDLGRFERDAVTLNTLLFSPRLMASRFNFLNPLSYGGLDPFVRQQKIRAALQTAGGISAVLWLASNVAGVKVSLNPTGADFGKIRVGNTRIDVAGGFVQYIRVLSSVAEAATGHGDGKINDQLLRFGRGKESPVASAVHDFATHTNYAGMPLPSWKKEIYDSFIPLVAQDVRDTYNQTGSIPAAVGAAAASGTGIGVQSYGARPTEPKHDTSPEGVAKTYIQEAEKAYPQLSESVRRAVRNRMVYEQARDQFKQDTYGGKQHAMTDRETAQVLLNVRIQEQPAVFTPENIAKAQQIVQQGSPYALSSFIRFSKSSLWEEVLRPIDKTLAARRKAKSFRQWQKTHR